MVVRTLGNMPAYGDDDHHDSIDIHVCCILEDV